MLRYEEAVPVVPPLELGKVVVVTGAAPRPLLIAQNPPEDLPDGYNKLKYASKSVGSYTLAS